MNKTQSEIRLAVGIMLLIADLVLIFICEAFSIPRELFAIVAVPMALIGLFLIDLSTRHKEPKPKETREGWEIEYGDK